MMVLELFFALAGIGLALVFAVLHYHRELAHLTLADARGLATLPVTKLSSASNTPDAVVKIVGIVQPTEPNVMSYFDRVPCVARRIEFRTHVDTKLEIGLTGIRTVDITEVERELKVFPFEIDDGTGRIAIDPKNVRFDFEVAGGEEGGSVFEHRIRVGEKVAAIGVVRVSRDANYRDAAIGPRAEFVNKPLVSWRSDAEFLPRLRPPGPVLVCLALGLLGTAGYAHDVMKRAAHRRVWAEHLEHMQRIREQRVRDEWMRTHAPPAP